MFSLSGNWLKWRRGRQKPPSRSESVFNVLKGSCVSVCLSACVRDWDEARLCGHGRTSGLPSRPCLVELQTLLSEAQILSDLSRLICSSDWKAIDTFEHIFPWKESLTVFREGQGQTSAFPPWRDSFFETLFGILLKVCSPKLNKIFYTYLLWYPAVDRHADSFAFICPG